MWTVAVDFLRTHSPSQLRVGGHLTLRLHSLTNWTVWTLAMTLLWLLLLLLLLLTHGWECCTRVCYCCRNLNPTGSFETDAWIERILIVGVARQPSDIMLAATGESLVESCSLLVCFVECVLYFVRYHQSVIAGATTRAAMHNLDEEHSPVFAGSWHTWG